MATRLYRQGTANLHKGIQCDIMVTDAKSVPAWIKRGWHSSIGDINGIETKPDVLDQFDTMSNKNIRLAAEKAGIEGYDKTRIQTLIEVLRGDSIEG